MPIVKMHNECASALCAKEYYGDIRKKLMNEGYGITKIIEEKGDSTLYIALIPSEIKIIPRTPIFRHPEGKNSTP